MDDIFNELNYGDIDMNGKIEQESVGKFMDDIDSEITSILKDKFNSNSMAIEKIKIANIFNEQPDEAVADFIEGLFMLANLRYSNPKQLVEEIYQDDVSDIAIMSKTIQRINVLRDKNENARPRLKDDLFDVLEKSITAKIFGDEIMQQESIYKPLSNAAIKVVDNVERLLDEGIKAEYVDNIYGLLKQMYEITKENKEGDK